MEEELNEIIKKRKKWKIILTVQIVIFIILFILLCTIIFEANRGSNSPISGYNESNNFNEKFEQYCGSSVRGATVNALINTINNNNRNNSNDKTNQVGINVLATKWNGDKSITATNGIYPIFNGRAITQESYSVISKYNDNGFINMLIIKDSEK